MLQRISKRQHAAGERGKKGEQCCPESLLIKSLAVVPIAETIASSSLLGGVLTSLFQVRTEVDTCNSNIFWASIASKRGSHQPRQKKARAWVSVFKSLTPAMRTHTNTQKKNRPRAQASTYALPRRTNQTTIIGTTTAVRRKLSNSLVQQPGSTPADNTHTRAQPHTPRRERHTHTDRQKDREREREREHDT